MVAQYSIYVLYTNSNDAWYIFLYTFLIHSTGTSLSTLTPNEGFIQKNCVNIALDMISGVY